MIEKSWREGHKSFIVYLQFKSNNIDSSKTKRTNPIVPISFVSTRSPMYKKNDVNKYTPEGREAIHKNAGVNINILRRLMENPILNESTEYNDNRLSLYSAQKGKCAITGILLNYDDIHCHHKKAKSDGGKDDYKNLIIIHKDIHILIHATNEKIINKYLNKYNLTVKMLNKINSYRKKLRLDIICS